MMLGWMKKKSNKNETVEVTETVVPSEPVEPIEVEETLEQKLAKVKTNSERYVELQTREDGTISISFENMQEVENYNCAFVFMSETTKKKVVCLAEKTDSGYKTNISVLKDEMAGEREQFRAYFAALDEKRSIGFRLMIHPEVVYDDSLISTIQPDLGRFKSMVEMKEVDGIPYSAVMYKLESSDRVSLLIDKTKNVQKLCEGQLKVVSEKKDYDYPYRFSCVMAVYNAEDYLKEAVDSIIHQTMNFKKHIQIILVDDGSKDSSPEICDAYAQKYPQNVMVIHKENGGVSTARNEGKKHALGKYVNFMDSDDIFDKDVFEKVWKFFERHLSETDVVTIPLQFFDATTGPHWQNYKFEDGSRVINLRSEYTASCMFVNASFIKNKLAKKYDFDERLSIAEDLKYMAEILINKFALGVVHDCAYRYRRRSDGVLSLVKSSSLKKVAYNGYLEYVVKYLIDSCKERFGFVPRYVQNTLLMDLQWKLRVEEIPEGVLTEEEEMQYKTDLVRFASSFDDDVILQQRVIVWEMKYFLLQQKHKHEMWNAKEYRDMVLMLRDRELRKVSQMRTSFDVFYIENGILHIEGKTVLYGIDTSAPIDIYLCVDGVLSKCESLNRIVEKKSIVGELAFVKAFQADIEIEEEILDKSFSVYVVVDGHAVLSNNVRYGKFTPFEHRFSNEYYVKEGYVVTHNKSSFVIAKLKDETEREAYEARFIEEVQKKLADKIESDATYSETEEYKESKDSLSLREEYFERLKQKDKEIWLISDRVNEAGDNGQALFEYIQGLQLTDVECYFVLSEESPDFKRLKEIGQVVAYKSREHLLLTMLADKVISSHGDEYVRNVFYGSKMIVKDIYSYKYVFLQHGITKDDLSDWLNKYQKNIALFVTSATQEYESILAGDYYYTENEVKLVGFPRYDKLIQDIEPKKQILFAPTWRKYLAVEADKDTGIRPYNKQFKESEYYQFYQTIMNDDRLLNKMRELGYTGKFIIHPALRTNGEDFVGNDVIDIVNENVVYNKEFIENAVMLTDYSSVAFDFAYLKKPVVYTQFDKEMMFKNHIYDVGYWDYDTMGFGPVCYDKDTVVDALIHLMERSCTIEDEYLKRIEGFYYKFDQKNCERVYNAIREL